MTPQTPPSIGSERLARRSEYGLGENSTPPPMRSIDWELAEARRPTSAPRGELRVALQRMRRLVASYLAVMCAGVWIGSFAGCGGDPPRGRVVTGTVAAEGTPLKRGLLTFVPTGATPGPRSSVVVRDGQFSTTEENGPWAGQFRVEIMATPPDILARAEGRSPSTVTPEEHRAFREIHEDFNAKSTLTAEVTDAGPNQFEFQVRFAPPPARQSH